MPKYHFVLNEIVEIVLVGPMPMDVDPSIIVLDNVSDVLLFAWSLWLVSCRYTRYYHLFVLFINVFLLLAHI